MDGEATPADVEHARRCPDCHARLETWKRMSAMVAAPAPAPSAEQRAAAIAAAMASQPVSEPTPLEDRRRRRAGHLIGTRVAAIAAVVVLAVGVGVAATDLAGGGGSNHASVASRGEPESRFGSTVPAPSVSPTFSLGSVVSLAQLVTSIRSHHPFSPGSTESAASATAGPSEPHALPLEACLPIASQRGAAGSAAPVFTATLTYRGTPATVFVFPVADRHVAVVTAADGCRLLGRVGF
jgi:hypothetical protein